VAEQERELGVSALAREPLGGLDQPGEAGGGGGGAQLGVGLREVVGAGGGAALGPLGARRALRPRSASSSSDRTSVLIRVRSACAAAAGLLETQRMSASIPQKVRRWRRSSPPAERVTSAQ